MIRFSIQNNNYKITICFVEVLQISETVSDSDLISKLDVKAKANNPLLQKLLDENRPVYG